MSLTIQGVIVSIVGTALVQFGLTESCSQEVVAYLPVLIGGVMSWVGRYRIGDVNIIGNKK